MIHVQSVTRTRVLLSSICFCVLFGAAHLVSAQTPDPAKTVVISQVYGGGGNSGAPLTNDFIELHNRGALAVSLSGWSVQYASSAGSSWQKTDLSGTLQPGQYFLVKLARGAGGTTDLPTPDITGTLNISATSGKVALVRTSSLLTGACPVGVEIVDFAGYGTADCFEGGAPAPAPSKTKSVARAGSGCIDTDSNDADFAVIEPLPRNSAAAALICAQPSAPISTCPATVMTLTGQPVSVPLGAADQDGIVASASIVSNGVAGISLSEFTPAPAVGGQANVLLAMDGTTPLGSYDVQVQFSNDDALPQSVSCTVQVSVTTRRLNLATSSKAPSLCSSWSVARPVLT